MQIWETFWVYDHKLKILNWVTKGKSLIRSKSECNLLDWQASPYWKLQIRRNAIISVILYKEPYRYMSVMESF